MDLIIFSALAVGNIAGISFGVKAYLNAKELQGEIANFEDIEEIYNRISNNEQKLLELGDLLFKGYELLGNVTATIDGSDVNTTKEEQCDELDNEGSRENDKLKS